MSQRSRRLAELLLEDPAVENVSSFIGVDGQNVTLNAGRVFITLKPHNTRKSAAAVIERLKSKLADFEGIVLYLQPVQDLTIESRVARTQFQLTLESANSEELATWAPRLVARLRGLPQVMDVASDLQDQGLQAYVTIDRDTAGRLGVTPAAIDNALYNAFGQRLVSTIFTQANQYRVVLEVKPEFARNPTALNDIYVPVSSAGAAATSGAGANPASSTATPLTAGATQVPLSAVAAVSERPGLLAINHIGQFPSTTISFNVAPGYALGEAVDAIEKAEKDLALPQSVRPNFQGTALAFRASLLNTLLLIVAAIITMYIVLGVLYESYVHPVTILSTLPSAGVGALLALLIARHDLGIIAIIGIILLIGIVKKNAILMIDFALDAQREEGLPPREAIRKASLLRFRPILMTTMAAMLGALPLMIGWGVGSELRHPLGIAMVGGLIFSQLLTLFTTPVIYLYFDRLGTRVRKRFKGEGPNVGSPSREETQVR